MLDPENCSHFAVDDGGERARVRDESGTIVLFKCPDCGAQWKPEED